MIHILTTSAKTEDLVGIKEKIDSVCPLNRFQDKPYWSSDCVSADQVYRIHKFVQRVIEETGVLIQDQVVNLFKLNTRAFPYNIQLIKIDRKTFNSDAVVEDQICQTITPLTEDCKTYIITNDIGKITIDELTIGDYAIATYWTEHRDPRYKNWFIGKYMVRYV